MAVYLSPLWGSGAQIFDAQGVVLANGRIETFQAGTTTPAETFTSIAGDVSNGTTITLDSSGRPPDQIWLTGGQAYKFMLFNSSNSQIGDTFDWISGVNDPGTTQVGGVSVWAAFSGTPTYISSTQFSVTGNQTSTFPVGTRVRFTVSAGTGHGTVSAVSFSSFTTVTIVPDGTVLDNGLTAVAVSINTVDGANVSSAAVDFKSSISYPAGSVGAALQSASIGTTTGGTSTAYTLTPAIPITSYVTDQSFLVQFNQASGANPTLNISSVGPKDLKQYTSTGAKEDAVLYANQITYVAYDGTDMVVLNPAPPPSVNPTHYSLVTSDSSAASRSVFLSAGTWQLSLTTTGNESDGGNCNFTVTQDASIVTLGTITTSYNYYRAGGAGFGRSIGGSSTAVSSITVTTAGTYTLSIASASVTGSGTGQYTPKGSTLHCEKLS